MQVFSHHGFVTISLMTLFLSETFKLGSGYEKRENFLRSKSVLQGGENSVRVLQNCDNLIPDGNFDGALSAWTTHSGGSLSIFQESRTEDGSGSLLVSDRSDRQHGPKLSIDPACVTNVGTTIRFCSYMKLATNATGNYQPETCDRFVSGPGSYNHPDVCPILSFKITKQDGNVSYAYAASFVGDSWVADDWNMFAADLLVTPDIVNAVSIEMYIERLREGVDMIIDDAEMKEVAWNLDQLGNERQVDETAADEFYEVNCTHMVKNADFEEGDGEGWSIHRGGKLLLYPDGFADSDTALLYTARNSPYAGPKHEIKSECVTEGKFYLLEGQIKLLDSDGNPFWCDKSKPWDLEVACPLLTVQYTNANGETKWSYYSNENNDVWIAETYNWFYAHVYMSLEMKTATSIFFYLERVKETVSLVYDNTQFSRDCEELIPNGYSTGSAEGWSPSHGNGWVGIQNRTSGNLTLESFFIHQGREGKDEGPRQDIDPICLVTDSKFEVSFDIKLLDANGDEFICDKNALSGTPNFCPLISFSMTSQTDQFEIFNVVNRDPTEWKHGYNNFIGFFTVTETMSNAKSMYFKIWGPAKEYDIVFDNLRVEPSYAPLSTCHELIYNGDFENGFEEWSTAQGGYLRVHDTGYDTLNGAVAHYNRTTTSSSMTHRINPVCLTEGKHYIFRAQVKLVDEYGNPYACDSSLDSTNNPDPCPVASIYIDLPTGIAPIHMPNKSPHAWNATGWNVYRSDFIINLDLARASLTEVKIRGPKAGITVILDSATIVEYTPPSIDCSSDIVINGDLPGEDHPAWTLLGGEIDTYYPGVFLTNTAIMHKNRPTYYSGLRQPLDTSCFVETKEYQLSTFFKLFDENMFPYQCDLNADWGSPDFCIVVAIEFYIGEEMHVINLLSDTTSDWVSDEWYFFHKIFTASADLSIADSAKILIKGPRSGVSILMDEVHLHEYHEPPGSCTQLVKNSVATSGDFLAWRVTHSGYYTFTTGGLGLEPAYMLTDRNHFSSGVRQNFDMSCLLTHQGQRLEVNGLFQLLDSEGIPYACDKTAYWSSPDYCVLFSLEMKTADGLTKRRHFGNAYQGNWIANDMNVFSTIFTVTQELAESQSAFFYFQGPPAGSSIVFDHITITPVSSSS